MIKKTIKKLMLSLKEEKKVPIVSLVPESKLLKNKVVLITGGSGGIGKAITRKILSSGGKVIIVGRNEQKLKNVCDSMTDDTFLRYCAFDYADISSYCRIVDETSRMFPENRIDILVNCAGTIDHSPFLEVNEKTFDNVLGINLKGSFFMCQAVAKHMIEKNIKGHILNLSSSSAMRPASTPYNISKWGIRGMTMGLADALLPYGIIVNAIGPGPTATEMLGKDENDSIYHSTNPSGRCAAPEEIANLALLMISGMGDMIVGETFYITGGSGTITLHG